MAVRVMTAVDPECRMPVFLYRCRDCQHEVPVADSRAQDSAHRTGHCERCGGPVELGRQFSPQSSSGGPFQGITERLYLRDAWLAMAETWYAWRVSRELLRWVQRVRSESGLTGIALYEQVIVQRSRLDVSATKAILRRAEESFCSWPASHELRFRDVAQYVVVHEYLRSHKEHVGTQTRMATTVARTIPDHL